jgi:coatomer protein complex subunit epsilon
VFEEAAQAPATSSTKALVGQAIAELHLGRLPEAEAALQQAMEKDATDASVLANMIVYSAIAGKDATDLISCVSLFPLFLNFLWKFWKF